MEFELIHNDTKYRIKVDALKGKLKKVKVNDQDFNVEMTDGDSSGEEKREVRIAGKDYALKLIAQKFELGRAEFELELNNNFAALEALLPQSQGQVIYQDSSNNIAADIKSKKEESRVKSKNDKAEVSAEGGVYAPMPGRIVAYKVKVGDTVSAGQVVAILEAMKMENELKAPKTGKVKSILFDQGDNVSQNKPIMIID